MLQKANLPRNILKKNEWRLVHLSWVKGEKKLSNRSYYKSLIDNKKDGAFLTDMDGDILLVNSKAETFTGYSEDEFLNLRLREIFVTLTGDDNPLDSDDIREFEKEIYLIKSSSYLIPVLFQLTEIEGGKFLCTIRSSVSGEKSMIPDSSMMPDSSMQETVVKENNDLQILSNNVKRGVLSDEEEHAVRNSLNTILGFSSILLKESAVATDRKLLGYVKSIINNGNNLKDILNFSDNSLSDNSDALLKKCLLSAVVQKSQILLQSKADQNSIEMVVDIPNEFAVVSDESVLTNVINYLLEKAISYCRSMFVDIKVRPSKTDGQLLLVIDNLGQDIPMGIKNFIDAENIKPSYDIDNQILLSNPEISTLLKNLNCINAKIKFDTSEDLGDIINVELPLYSETVTGNDELQSNKSPNGVRKKALIIEDDKLNAIILKNHLQQFVDTSTAFSGNEALNIIENLNDKGVDFDIVFADIGLPPPWDGISLKKEIVNRWSQYENIPFIAQTGYSAKSYSEKIRSAGFAGYLVKPINRNDIKKFVNSI